MAAIGTALVVLVLDEVATADTVAGLVRDCLGADVVDRAVAVDGGSTDGTPPALDELGIEVVAADSLPPGGTVRGKGDSVRRATNALDAERFVLVDGDVEGLGVETVRALRDALDLPRVHLAKASFDRVQRDGTTQRELGGRVTELLARPLLHRFAPDLDHVHVPLSGQQAVRAKTLRELPLLSGYGLEMGLLLAVRDRLGAEAVVDVPVAPISHDSKTDASLVPMAHQVLAAAAWGLGLDGSEPLDPDAAPGADLLVLPPVHPAVVPTEEPV